MRTKQNIVLILGLTLASLAYLKLAAGIERYDSTSLFLAFGTAALGYVLIQKNSAKWQHILVIGLVFRLLFFGHSPQLSPDSYRYLWDGAIQLLNINPFIFSPQTIYTPQLFPTAPYLYEQMGNLHQSYPSIYPPISQFLFKWVSYWGGTAVAHQLVGLRLHYILFELGVFVVGLQLLKKLQQPTISIGWYYLNPLVIIELTGNLHNEGVLLFFWGLGLLTVLHKKDVWAGVFLGLAIGTKIVPFIELPLLFVYLGKRRFLRLLLGLLPTLVVCWIPFWETTLLVNYWNTFSLWFNRFEFNASAYYVVRWLGWQVVGYNIIGWWSVLFPLLFGSGVLWYCVTAKKTLQKNLILPLLLVLTAYFFGATTVHPWYLISILFFGSLTTYRFPVVWTLAAFSSYHTYGLDGVQESAVILACSYGLVLLVLLYEVQKKGLKAS